MFDNQILKTILDKYGHIEDVEQLRQTMSQDGLGQFVDMIDDNMLDSFIEEHREEIDQSLKNYYGTGTIGKEEPVDSISLDLYDTFRFDQQQCLTSCDGKCCKERNYIMISYSDIFRILSSPYARHSKILSTRDLFESKPPVIESFFNEEYGLYLPYLRFLPEGTNRDIRPEDAENCRCPFLYPMMEVYSFHKLELPQCVGKEAMGCILMNDKPQICRLSPVGQFRGMETGRVSYEYTEPARDCPACESDVEIPLNHYIKSVKTYIEEKEDAAFHKILMANKARHDAGNDQKRFNSILLEFYNIDRLLALYGYAQEKRPRYRQLMEILIAAAKGDFSLYESFTQGSIAEKQLKSEAKIDFFSEKIIQTISGMYYSIEPFLKASKAINIYNNFFELENFYFNDWEKQNIDGAMGLCQHLSSIANLYLQNLSVDNRIFSDYYDIFYASGVHESRFFNLPHGNHICLIVFKKGETDKGWIIDPSLKAFLQCHKEPNKNKNSIKGDDVYTTSNHQYFIPATLGSSVRKVLEVKEDVFSHYSSSFDSYLPLFIHDNQSLILAKFLRKKDHIKVEYYEHKENCVFSQRTLIGRQSRLYRKLYDNTDIFSTIETLLTKVTIIDSSDLDKHQRLVSSELEEDYMMALYYIELAVTQIYRNDQQLTDKIVFNALNDLICQKINKSYELEYLKLTDEKLHKILLNQINSANLESKFPQRILINALKQVKNSVQSFIKRGEGKNAYLKFVIGYFKA